MKTTKFKMATLAFCLTTTLTNCKKSNDDNSDSDSAEETTDDEENTTGATDEPKVETAGEVVGYAIDR